MKNVIFRLIKYLEKYKMYIIVSLIGALISVITSLLGPMLIGRAIDKMIGLNNVNFSYVLKIIIILCIIYALGIVFTWVLTYATNVVSYNVTNTLRGELFDKINKLPLKFFDNNPHGDTISRFVNDMDTISDGMLQTLCNLFTGIITIIGAIGFMLYVSPIMTIVVLLSSVASFFMARFITLRSQKLFKEQAKVLGNLNGYIEEIIGGQKVVKAFNYEEKSFNKFKEINKRLYEAGVKSQFYGSLSGPTTRVVNNIAFAVVGLFGCMLSISGKITVGEISSFLIYATLFAKPINDITAVFTQIQAAAASASRIFNILDMECEIPEHNDDIELKNLNGSVEFKNVNFSYNKENPLIKNFNLYVKPGNKIAIVGKTGAGKTTIVNLLMRFYEINSGKILVDDVDIDKIRRASLRKSFGMVLQDTWLFTGTIKENIAYGKSNATEEEVIAAAKAAHAHNFIMRLPNGYDTVISGASDGLSQGQKQLLTIARVMLVDPPMLILDEATSSIDTRTEIQIQDAFLKMLKGRTSFIIAHRLSTIREADIILVMDNGNVVESGNHEELLKKKGYYEKLYMSQFSKS